MQKVEIVRGTTNTFQISVVDSLGAPYNLGSQEKLWFGIKKDPEDKTTIFQKLADVVDEGLFQVVIEPEDTENLEGDMYYYDVGLQSGNLFFNVIPYNPFVIIPNITSREVAT